jgi:hypothetical protein
MNTSENTNSNIGRSADIDFALVRKIMETIERHYEDEQVAPAPASLRDDMLAVAALLHIQNTKIAGDSPAPEKRPNDLGQEFHGAFGEIAVRQLRAVLEIVAHKHGDLQ